MSMARWVLIWVLFAGCGHVETTLSIRFARQYDLVSVGHNQANGYTLVEYRSPLSERIYLLRRGGVAVMMLSYRYGGDVYLWDVASGERQVTPERAEAIRAQMQAFLVRKKTRKRAKT